MAYSILLNLQEVVVNVYLLIYVILATSLHLAEIALLGFVQILLCNCFEGAGLSAKAKHAFVVTNWIILTIFIALWAGMTTYSIRYEYHLIADISNATFSEIVNRKKLLLAFSVIFLLVGIEIMVLSFRIRSGAKQRNHAILPTVSSSWPLQMVFFLPANPTKYIDWNIPDVLDRTTADHPILHRYRLYCPVRYAEQSLRHGPSRPAFL